MGRTAASRVLLAMPPRLVARPMDSSLGLAPINSLVLLSADKTCNHLIGPVDEPSDWTSAGKTCAIDLERVASRTKAGTRAPCLWRDGAGACDAVVRVWTSNLGGDGNAFLSFVTRPRHQWGGARQGRGG